MRYATALALLCLGGPLQAQSAGIEIGRFFGDTGRTTYRLGFGHRLLGSLGAELFGTYVDGPSGSGKYWGAGLDLNLFRDGRPGAYLVGGLSGGFNTDAGKTFWSSWSAGLGYDVSLLGSLRLAAEGRWRVLNPGHRDGLELGVRLALVGGGGRRGGDRSVTTVRRETPLPPDPATTHERVENAGLGSANAELLSGVVQTATAEMGSPYHWGGSSEGAEGFDCSGLIQYSYGQHGVTLPRRSADQAMQGRAVDRSLSALVPGDILTFSSDGDRVTHVGLYVGDGKFIHSARGGVQLSVLSEDDTYGKWWWKRWVGARRVVN